MKDISWIPGTERITHKYKLVCQPPDLDVIEQAALELEHSAAERARRREQRAAA